MPPGQSGLFFTGDTLFDPAVAVGNGLACVGGNSIRFTPTTTGTTGTVTFASPVAASLGLITPGTTFHFQFWHRDPLAPPCTGGSNLTNAYSISFTP